MLSATESRILLAAKPPTPNCNLVGENVGHSDRIPVSLDFLDRNAGGQKRRVLARTEGDPLNAVAATTLAIRRYSPTLVITFGAARAHDLGLQVGDVVVSEKFAAFDGMYSHVTAPTAGSDALKWEPLPHLLMQPGEKEVPAMAFPADPAVLVAARKLHLPHGRLVPGILGSAGQVNREADRIAWLHARWGTSCEDAESAHVAGCAQLLR